MHCFLNKLKEYTETDVVFRGCIEGGSVSGRWVVRCVNPFYRMQFRSEKNARKRFNCHTLVSTKVAA